LRERRLWSFTENEVSKLTVRQNGSVRELLHNGTNAWQFAAGSQGVVNNFATEETAGTLGELGAAWWTARGDASRAQFAQFGFTEASPQISVELKRGGKAETLTLELGGVAPSQLRYGATMVDGQRWIFELPVRTGEMLRSYLLNPGEP
jgi:hypothetical protein